MNREVRSLSKFRMKWIVELFRSLLKNVIKFQSIIHMYLRVPCWTWIRKVIRKLLKYEYSSVVSVQLFFLSTFNLFSSWKQYLIKAEIISARTIINNQTIQPNGNRYTFEASTVLGWRNMNITLEFRNGQCQIFSIKFQLRILTQGRKLLKLIRMLHNVHFPTLKPELVIWQ